MKNEAFSCSSALVAGFAIVATIPAAAIDAQPGGRAGAVATIGEDKLDAGDVVVNRCECDGGPLEAIEVRTQNGGTRTVRIDEMEGTVIRTNDVVAVEVGTVFGIGNADGDIAITIMVLVKEGVLGAAERIAVRRTGFYWTPTGLVIDAGIADLERSVAAAAAAGV